MGVVEQHLLDELAPIITDDLADYVEAISQMFAEVELYSTDQGDEWDRGAYSNLLDVDRCPAAALPYLACFVGVVLPVGTPEAQARELIRAQNAANRGTPAAIIAAAQSTLTGAKYCDLNERDTSAYHATVSVRTAQCPDPAATLAAINAVKPAGIVISLVVTDGITIDELAGTIDSLTGTVDDLA